LVAVGLERLCELFSDLWMFVKIVDEFVWVVLEIE